MTTRLSPFLFSYTGSGRDCSVSVTSSWYCHGELTQSAPVDRLRHFCRFARAWLKGIWEIYIYPWTHRRWKYCRGQKCVVSLPNAIILVVWSEHSDVGKLDPIQYLYWLYMQYYVGIESRGITLWLSTPLFNYIIMMWVYSLCCCCVYWYCLNAGRKVASW